LSLCEKWCSVHLPPYKRQKSDGFGRSTFRHCFVVDMSYDDLYKWSKKDEQTESFICAISSGLSGAGLFTSIKDTAKIASSKGADLSFDCEYILKENVMIVQSPQKSIEITFPDHTYIDDLHNVVNMGIRKKCNDLMMPTNVFSVRCDKNKTYLRWHMKNKDLINWVKTQ
jgi:hypothetical protein